MREEDVREHIKRCPEALSSDLKDIYRAEMKKYDRRRELSPEKQGQQIKKIRREGSSSSKGHRNSTNI
jgi:hypothetical protein